MKLNTCEEEYAKDPMIKKQDILQLIEWRNKMEHLPEISEYMLILFYKCCEYSLQQSKKLIDFHYTYKNTAAEFFQGIDFEPPKYKHKYFDIINFFVSDKITPEGYRIIYTGLRDTDSTKYNFTIAINMALRIMFTSQLGQSSCSGYIVVWNIEGTTAGHMASASLILMKNFLTYVQEAIPMQVKKIHIVNVNAIFSKIMLLTKHFMKKELIELIQIHQNPSTLLQVLSPELLPTDIDGTSMTALEGTEKMKTAVYELWDDVTKELHLKADMNKLSVTEAAKFTSMNGSFKKLDLD